MIRNSDIDDLTADRKAKPLAANKRRTVRYVRKDIAAHICIDNWFGRIGVDWFRKEIPVELLDISNRGCLVACSEKLAMRTKIRVTLTFGSGMCFEIEATVVRKAEGRDQYGIKFAEYNNALGEYMLKTQEQLTFK